MIQHIPIHLDVAFFSFFLQHMEKKSNFFIIICASKLFLCFLKDYGEDENTLNTA